ncbi:MAG: FecR family protein [Pseudomonadota bacterium]
MLRQSMIIACLWLTAQLAYAAEAGKVIFVAGAVQGGDHALTLNAAVKEGELLSTGADGYVYIKTIDNGLFILRPNTKARIATYHVDAANPANTRIKLELLSGVARSQSGEAVKLARQNFRFNTPVAAIGVRGTDFTVFTDDQVSRVAVLSGGITISGFAGACRPEGTGPCEGSMSRELSAAQRGTLLQIHRGQGPAQLVPASTNSPDSVAPPRGDEPIGKNNVTSSNASVAVGEPILDPVKLASLKQSANAALTPATPAPGTGTPSQPPPVIVDVPALPPVVVPPVVVDPGPQVPERTIVWGRFQAIAGAPAQVDIAAQAAAKSQYIAAVGNYALMRTDGKDYVVPERGSVAFALKQSDAYIYSDNVTVAPVKAGVENGVLGFNFDKRTFATSFDLVNQTERIKMEGVGRVTSDGRFSQDAQPGAPLLSIDGVLSSEKGGSAAYIFMGRIVGDRTANGVTYWGAIK